MPLWRRSETTFDFLSLPLGGALAPTISPARIGRRRRGRQNGCRRVWTSAAACWAARTTGTSARSGRTAWTSAGTLIDRLARHRHAGSGSHWLAGRSAGLLLLLETGENVSPRWYHRAGDRLSRQWRTRRLARLARRSARPGLPGHGGRRWPGRSWGNHGRPGDIAPWHRLTRPRDDLAGFRSPRRDGKVSCSRLRGPRDSGFGGRQLRRLCLNCSRSGRSGG